MKKLLLSATVVAGLFAAPTIDSLQKQINELQKQLKELKAKQEAQNDRYYKKVAPVVANNHVFWSYDLRSSYDLIQYKFKNGTKNTNNILSNRVTLTGVYKVNDSLKATLKLQANNIYGMNGNANIMASYDNSNWFASETPDDTNIRVKEAFFNYYFGDDGEYMFSAGRRPSVGGYPANLREGDVPTSPVAHLVNMEFDGMSLWFKNGAFTKLSDKFEDWGTNLKFCFGRGFSPNSGKFNNLQAPYSKNDTITDFGGFLLVPYNDGQYSVWSENIWAWNLKGYQFATVDVNGDGKVDQNDQIMDTVGKYFGTNWIFKADGIGDGISDFLDDTKAFVSVAYTRTIPDSGKTMQGSASTKSGTSIWIGADMPAGESGRFGFNYVHGSKYYRSMTWGEDTLVGSIAATRGNAYELYYIRPIIDHLTFGLRGTYIKYNYAGSNGFFGNSAIPNLPNYVEKATDIRAYIRYNF